MHTSRVAVIAFCTLLTLAACGGDKPADTPPTDTATATAVPSTTTPTPDSTAAPTDSAAPVAASAADLASGKEVFNRCIACHQVNGAGIPGAFPPLAGSEWVTGPASRPIAVLLHGLQGELTVNGVKYNSAMMAYGTGVPMSDKEIADVVSYIRASFGNAASAVSTADVAKVRAALASRTTPLTQKDLEALQ